MRSLFTKREEQPIPLPSSPSRMGSHSQPIRLKHPNPPPAPCCEASLWKGRSEGLLASQQLLTQARNAPIYISNDTRGLVNQPVLSQATIARAATPSAHMPSPLTPYPSWRGVLCNFARRSPSTALALASILAIVSACVVKFVTTPSASRITRTRRKALLLSDPVLRSILNTVQ